MKTDPTVFLVDDDDAVRASISRFLTASGLHVRSFASAQELLADRDLDRPGCLLLDLKMPGIDGLELQEALNESASAHPIVFLTGHGSVGESVAAMKAGATDFLEKPAEPSELLATVKRAISLDARQRQEAQEIAALIRRLDRLTPRERQVFERVVAGRLNKQIAFELGVSEKTVKVHRGRVMDKMQVQSLAELARLAERLGIAVNAT
jgi:RNA polymerase sigma factor (sigma-70 family)